MGRREEGDGVATHQRYADGDHSHEVVVVDDGALEELAVPVDVDGGAGVIHSGNL